MKKGVNWKVLIACLIILYAFAALASITTVNRVSTEWYENIKPGITPPNYVFPIVWNILFFLIALSLYFAWTSSAEKAQAKDPLIRKKIAISFGANLFLNIFWSFLYFTLQNPLYAFYEVFILWISIIAMIYITWKINKTSSLLLVPYLLWVSFAIVLNYLSI